MSYEVEFDPQAFNQLKSLDQSVSQRIISKIEDLQAKPTHFAKPLTGIDLWRLRVGDYRVLFDLYEDDELIYVIKVGHRDDFYKNLN